MYWEVGVFRARSAPTLAAGGAGAGGVSMLLVERTPDLATKRMDCQGVRSGAIQSSKKSSDRR